MKPRGTLRASVLGFSPLFNRGYQAVIAAKFRVWAALFSITLLLVSCAGQPGADKRAVEDDIETILRQPLEKSEYAEAKRCLGERDYDDFRVLDDKRIVFEGRRGELWLNTLRTRCPELRHAMVLRVKSFSSMGRICDMDSFSARDWFGRDQWGSRGGGAGTCSLGSFEPVTAAQVGAIQAALDASIK